MSNATRTIERLKAQLAKTKDPDARDAIARRLREVAALVRDAQAAVERLLEIEAGDYAADIRRTVQSDRMAIMAARERFERGAVDAEHVRGRIREARATVVGWGL